MKDIIIQLNKFYSRLTFFIFSRYARLRVSLSRKQSRKILVSRVGEESWMDNLKAGFQNTRHEVAFWDFSKEEISHYDCLVPVTIRDLVYLDDHGYKVSENPLPIPSKESVLLCDDKYRFNRHMVKLGFGHLIPKLGIKEIFPYILKKKVDVSGNNCYIIFDNKQEEKHHELIADSEYFTQELVAGSDEYATHVLFKDGKIVNSLNIKYKFDKELPVKGQDKPLYTRITRCPHLDVFSDILKKIKFEGLCCFNYKEKDNLPMIIEINPRCGYSLSPYLYFFIHRLF